MTKNFDTLIEGLLTKLISEAPVSMEGSPEEMASAVSRKIETLPGKSQHWGPLQKLSAGDRERIIRSIIKSVFTERGHTYTPMADDPEQLKELVKSAITKATKDNPAFKAGGKWAVQFLADRMTNKDLLGNVKYTTEGGQEIKKDVTQKEMKAALNKALNDSPAQSSWRRSSTEEAPAKVEKPVEEEPAETKKEVDTVYMKAADLASDDEDLQKAFAKLPDDKEMSWEEVLKKVGTTKGLALIDAGGLSEITKEREVGEEENVPALEVDDEDSADLSNFNRVINPYFNTTKGSYKWED